MPKSKVRKKSDAPVLQSQSTPAGRQLSASPTWYPILFTVVLVIGLAYLVTYYLTSSGTSPRVPFMGDIGGWNFAVGFGILIVGLILAVRWR